MSPIWTDPERMSGTPCFTGTRVPVQSLFDLLTHGHNIDEFLEGFPSVRREQVVAVLNTAATSVIPPSQRPDATEMSAGAA